METYRLTTLPGGERVITEHVEGVRSASIGLWIGAGSRDESVARAGVSHFMEHLLFKGTERYDAVQIAELFDAMGGELNAATSRETTVVYTRVPDDHLDVALDVMPDMVFEPALADIDSEREVVLEEIAMVEDNPQDVVHDLAAEAVFGSHPLGRPVIGRADVISSVSRRALLGYHRGAYTGPNVVLAAAGNIDHDRIAAALAGRRANGVAPPPARGRKPAGKAPRPTIIFQRKSSRLFQEIREKRGMAYSVYTYGSQYVDAGQVGIYVGTRGENLRECLEVIAHELREVGVGNLRDGELERAKENMKGRMLLSLESTSARMTRLGKATVCGTEIIPVEEVERRIASVTPDEIASLARELYAPESLSAAGIGPSERRFRAAVSRFNPDAVARAA